jgi:porin
MLQIYLLVMLISLLPAKTGAQQPAPDYRGDLWSRQRLTGDWGGVRTRLAEKGFTFDLDFSILQGVVSGGRDTTTRWGGASELVLNLDSQKLGLWPGGFFLARAESAFKHGVNANTGSVMPVNTRIVLPLPARDEIVLSHVMFTQFLSEQFGVVYDKLEYHRRRCQ